MADFSALKTSIQNYIKQNGNEEITGNLLQQILLSMVTTLGDSAINNLVTALNTEIANRGNADATLQGNINSEATTRANADTELGGRITTLQGVVNGIVANIGNGYVYAGIATPSTTPASGKVFYLALTAGTYTNFGATVVPQGINVLKYNGSAWSLDTFIGLDDAPTQGSNNLVKSGGVHNTLALYLKNIATPQPVPSISQMIRGYIHSYTGNIVEVPGGSVYTREISVESGEIYIINNVVSPTGYYTSLTYAIYDSGNNVLRKGQVVSAGTTAPDEIVVIPTNGIKLCVIYNMTNSNTNTKLFKLDTYEQIQALAEELFDKTNKRTNITLEHGDGSAIVDFTKQVPNILHGAQVYFKCLQYSAGTKAVVFFDKSGNELGSINQTGGSGQMVWLSGIAPENTFYMELRYRESTYSGSYGTTECYTLDDITSLYYDILYIIDQLDEVPSYSQSLTFEHGDGSAVVDFTKQISMNPYTYVEFKCLQYLVGTKAVVFYDSIGNELGSINQIGGSGQMVWLSGISPKGTSYAKFNYRENTYSGSYGTTSGKLIIDLKGVNDALIDLNSEDSGVVIVFNGDSTGQGLDGSLSRSTFNNEVSLTRGSVGSENVLATAARQGSIPLFVLPFTIPTNSIARWTNSNNSIVAEGNDPQVIYSSSLLYHTEYDAQGMPETPSVSPYTTLHFAPAAGFYCNIGGVDGYLYSLPHYHVENGQVVIDSEGFPDMYFHRLVAGDQVIIDKVTEVIPSSAKKWRDSYQVNLMGTNQGFQTYKNDDYILLGTSVDALINAMEGSTLQEKTEAAYREAAKNLFDIQKRMSRNAKDYLVVGFFCEVSTSIFNKIFYEEYENLCNREFGSHFFNARLYLKDQAWKDLGVTLTDADKTNISIGLPPWSLFGDGTGQPSGNPHLTNNANKALANQVALRIAELGWVKSYPTLYNLSNL